MELHLNGRSIDLKETQIDFLNTGISDVFAQKNNKTLQETIKHRRYAKFTKEIELQYAEYIDYPLGTFLMTLKEKGDLFYKQFLNPYGDSYYCAFSLRDKDVAVLKGIYAFFVRETLMYIGRCCNDFYNRITMGYGRISPKNCYIDGQATNCHINQLINVNVENTRLFYCSLSDNIEIKKIEKTLIKTYNPEWNISMKVKLI